MPQHYFSLRSRLAPEPSALPLIVLAVLAALVVLGIFTDVS